MQEVIMLVGPQASGKTGISKTYIDRGYRHVSRDLVSGKVMDLLPAVGRCLAKGESVVLDNTFPTNGMRQPFIDLAKQHGVPVKCVLMDIKIEDCQINALHRMWDRYECVFRTANEIADHPQAKNDPNIFPPAVLFLYRKQFEKPTMAEGYAKIEKIKFKRNPLGTAFCNKAVIFDYDGTLRFTNGGNGKYPCQPSEVSVIPGRGKVMQYYRDQGYLLLGASNQSGVSKGVLSREQAKACFDETHKQLGVTVDELQYCPHLPPGDSCYCVKPQSGMGVYFIRKYFLDPDQCIYVGDQTKDRTWANRLGFEHFNHVQFFEEGLKNAAANTA